MLSVASSRPDPAGVPVPSCRAMSSSHTSFRVGSSQTEIVGGVEFFSACPAAAVAELDRPCSAHSFFSAASAACCDGVTAYPLQASPPTVRDPIGITVAPCCSSNCKDRAALSCGALSCVADAPSGNSIQCLPPRY